MTFKARARTLFIDRYSEALPHIDAATQFNIILSPTLYWVKRLKLPVRSVREVRTLLPSIFEDAIGDTLVSYTIKKEGEYFIAIAYSDKEILELLAQKGVKSTQVKAFYFAQFEIDAQTPICMNARFSLVRKDDLLIALPRDLFDSCEELDVNSMALSRHAVSLSRYSHLFNKRLWVPLIAASLLLMSIFGLQWYMNAATLSTLEAKRAAIYRENGLQATSFQNSALKKRLEKVYRAQMFIRTTLQRALAFRLQKDEYIKKIETKQSNCLFEVKLATKQRFEALKQTLTGRKRLLSMKEGIYRFEVTP